MRILLAAADRDLLRSYQSLLEEALGETVTAFDGTQVLTLAAEDPFDVVVLDRDIPRVHYRHIVQRLSNADIPVIVLMPEPQTSLLLQGDPLANAYLSFPFTSAAMIDTIRDVTAKKASGRRFSCGGQEVDVPAFRFTGGPRLTAAEMDILRLFSAGESVDAARIGVYIGALNGKLTKMNSRARIRYRAGEGYQLVTQDE